MKERADRALKSGVEFIGNKWAIPEDLMNLGLAYLVERARGRDDVPYADAVVRQWGDGSILRNKEGCAFGYHSLAYDWIYDALTPEQRVRYGDALGAWLRWFTDTPEITLKAGHWEYNQTRGPRPPQRHAQPGRDHAEALHRAGDRGVRLEVRVRREELPGFLEQAHPGGVPSRVQPHGRCLVGVHGARRLRPGDGHPLRIRRVAERDRDRLLQDGLPGGAAALDRLHDDAARRPDRVDRRQRRRPPGGLRARRPVHARRTFPLPGRQGTDLDPRALAARRGPRCVDRPGWTRDAPARHLLQGAGHVYVRSAWNDPNATWGFFGAGPQFAGHSRDDEGHFLISKKGALVSRAGGEGGNDDDYYSGGSIIYNLVTIYDPAEKFRRDRANENDGGLLRGVYLDGPWPRERGHITAFETTAKHSYNAADLTKGYLAAKAKEVTRQFLYLRGTKEYFIIFDRIEAADPAFRRHWFLHVPTEPASANGALDWLSLPEADGDKRVLSKGRSRAFLHTLLPEKAGVTVRGGPGKEA